MALRQLFSARRGPRAVAHPPGRFQRLCSRSLWLALTLALAFSAGPVGQAPLAQAAPDAAPVGVSLVVDTSSGDLVICVGDKVGYWTRARKQFEIVGQGIGQANLVGVEVQATVADPSIGTIAPASAWTGSTSNPMAGVAYFTFTALKEGFTKLLFMGILPRTTVLGWSLSADTITAEGAAFVRQCEYQVSAVLMMVAGGAEPISWTGYITKAGLTKDPEAQGQYQGSGIVLWSAHTVYGSCVVENHPTQSFFTMRGEKVGDLLEVRLEFEPAHVLGITMSCPNGGTSSGLDDLTYTPDSVRVWVPAIGGTATRNQGFGQVPLIFGRAVVTVYPLAGE